MLLYLLNKLIFFNTSLLATFAHLKTNYFNKLAY